MYPLHQSEEKCFQISFNPHQHIIPEDLILGHVLEGQNGVKNIMGKGKHKRRKLLKTTTTSDNNLHGDNNHVFDDQQKHETKMIHRERERQRRQEMGSLYMSLRTLLPLEFIKGKRAISDQMNGAVNYIKYQKKRIKEMEEKRDELKKLENLDSVERSRSGLSNPVCSFKIIQHFGGGLEIMITTNGFHGFPLSRILKVVVEEGLDVVNCGSSSVNDKSVHTIQMEVIDSTSIDLLQLEKKLMEAVPMLRKVTDN